MSRTRLPLGPGSALIVGLAMVVGTGNGDRLLHILHRTTGAMLSARGAVTGDEPGSEGSLSAADVLAAVNTRLEAALREMREMVLAETRQGDTMYVATSSGGSWTLFWAKSLLIAGTVVGVCQLCDIDLSAMLGMSKPTVEKTLKRVQNALQALASGCHTGVVALSTALGQYRGRAVALHAEAGAQIEAAGAEVEAMRCEVAQVAEVVHHLTALSDKANGGLQLLCHVLSENLPPSHAAKQPLLAYASQAQQLGPLGYEPQKVLEEEPASNSDVTKPKKGSKAVHMDPGELEVRVLRRFSTPR